MFISNLKMSAENTQGTICKMSNGFHYSYSNGVFTPIRVDPQVCAPLCLMARIFVGQQRPHLPHRPLNLVTQHPILLTPTTHNMPLRPIRRIANQHPKLLNPTTPNMPQQPFRLIANQQPKLPNPTTLNMPQQPLLLSSTTPNMPRPPIPVIAPQDIQTIPDGAPQQEEGKIFKTRMVTSIEAEYSIVLTNI